MVEVVATASLALVAVAFLAAASRRRRTLEPADEQRLRAYAEHRAAAAAKPNSGHVQVIPTHPPRQPRS